MSFWNRILSAPVSTPINPRIDAARRFLQGAGWAGVERAPLSGDASSRSYERLRHWRLGPAVLMNAPPEEGVGPAPFAAVTGYLRNQGLSAPEIYAADLEQGFLLLEDLGDALYARVIEQNPGEELALYRAAAEALAALHAKPAPEIVSGYGAEMPLAPYDRSVLLREARLLLDWALPALTGAAPNAEAEESFVAAIDALIPSVKDARSALVLRDYHAENLLWLPNRTGIARVGQLDYQDALAGHPAYDLVSLIEDARRDVSNAAAEATLQAYVDASGADLEELRSACAVLGAQRNAKIVGIFTRLALRDRKPRYLSLIPRVWAHLMKDLEHPDGAALKAWIDEWLPVPDARLLDALSAGAGADGAPRPGDTPLDTAMVLAAGLGTRMRPLTDSRPKPLLDCAGKTLLDRTLDRTKEAGVRRAVINAHYLAEQVEARLEERSEEDPDVELQLSLEKGDKALETGGGVKAALPALDRSVFYVVNSDNVWTGRAAFEALRRAWKPEEMDALLLLVPMEQARGYTRAGDFFLGAGGRLIRRGSARKAPMVYTGAQILSRRSFERTPSGAFSLNVVWDKLIAEDRAFGVAHPAEWADVGTPDGLANASRMLAAYEGAQ